MPPTHEPERTCVGCRERAVKAAMLRVARAPDGDVAVDAGGRAPGRGAYVHRDPACVDAAISRGGLWRALRTHADPDAADRLRRDLERELRT